MPRGMLLALGGVVRFASALVASVAPGSPAALHQVQSQLGYAPQNFVEVRWQSLLFEILNPFSRRTDLQIKCDLRLET